MGDKVTGLAERIMVIDWTGSFDHMRSRGYLMKEYLRRMAWWAKVTEAPDFPFFDIAAAVDPAVRADPSIVDLVQTRVKSRLQGLRVVRACEQALHFAALLDAGVELPPAPPEPYEPLLVMFERGGGFSTEGGGLIEVDSLGIRIGSLEDNLIEQPVIALDQSALDAADGK
jgi:hypothetical protein